MIHSEVSFQGSDAEHFVARWSAQPMLSVLTTVFPEVWVMWHSKAPRVASLTYAGAMMVYHAESPECLMVITLNEQSMVRNVCATTATKAESVSC